MVDSIAMHDEQTVVVTGVPVVVKRVGVERRNVPIGPLSQFAASVG